MLGFVFWQWPCSSWPCAAILPWWRNRKRDRIETRRLILSEVRWASTSRRTRSLSHLTPQEPHPRFDPQTPAPSGLRTARVRGGQVWGSRQMVGFPGRLCWRMFGGPTSSPARFMSLRQSQQVRSESRSSLILLRMSSLSSSIQDVSLLISVSRAIRLLSSIIRSRSSGVM